MKELKNILLLVFSEIYLSFAVSMTTYLYVYCSLISTYRMRVLGQLLFSRISESNQYNFCHLQHIQLYMNNCEILVCYYRQH